MCLVKYSQCPAAFSTQGYHINTKENLFGRDKAVENVK